MRRAQGVLREMENSAHIVLVFLLCSFTVSVWGIKCYQCNVECRTNAGVEGCELSNTTDYVTDNETNSKRVSCDNPSEESNCVACMKVFTGNRRYDHKGEFIANKVISKVCQKSESPYDEDICDYSGPEWAKGIVCYCYSDFCNSAPSLHSVGIPFFVFILQIFYTLAL